MRLTINIELNAEADREGETQQDEQSALDAGMGLAGPFAESIKNACEAKGLTASLEWRSVVE